MSVPAEQADSAQSDAVSEHIEKIRHSGILGKSAQLNRLFEYLFFCHQQGRTPKEFEIAVDGLGRSSSFDVSQDAMVRVYIHKLRKKFDEYYAAAGRNEALRLTLPKGEYRLVLQASDMACGENALPQDGATLINEDPHRLQGQLRKATRILLVLSIALNIAFGIAWFLAPTSTIYRHAYASIVWRPLLADERQITLVVGDYYLYAETDGHDVVRRLVRDFEVNSKSDLADQVGSNTRLAERRFDVGLSYLPTATAHALNRLSPYLSAGRKQPRIMLSSELTAEVLRNDHIVFIGHFSALALLNDIVLEASGFRVGHSFDELVDKKTGQRFISSSGIPADASGGYSHLGYFASFAGPTGNRIVIVAGLRDAGLKELANLLASEQKNLDLPSKGADLSFEAVYQSSGFGPTTSPARLLLSRPLPDNRARHSDLAKPPLPAAS